MIDRQLRLEIMVDISREMVKRAESINKTPTISELVDIAIVCWISGYFVGIAKTMKVPFQDLEPEMRCIFKELQLPDSCNPLLVATKA